MTDQAQRALGLARRLAGEADAEIGLDHLLAGMLAIRDGAAVKALENAGLAVERLRSGSADGEPRTEPGPHASAPVRDVLRCALAESIKAGHGFVGTAHFLLGFLGTEGGRAALVELGADVDRLGELIAAAIVACPEQQSLRSVPPTQEEFAARSAAAYNLQRFARAVEGAPAEAAQQISRQLDTRIRAVMLASFRGAAADDPAGTLRAQQEGIQELDAALAEARRALAEIGLQVPQQSTNDNPPAEGGKKQ